MSVLDHIAVQPEYFIYNVAPKVLVTPRPYRFARQLNFRDFMCYVGDKSPQQLVNESVQPENWLGMGRFKEIYALPGTDRYVLKVHRSMTHDDYATHKPPVVQSTSFTAMKIAMEQLNFGQSVAYIDLFGARTTTEICRRVWGQPFMWFQHSKFREESRPAIYISNLKAIAFAADLPQDAYDYMALQLAMISDYGYSWEAHSENLMLTVGARGLGLVDVEPYPGDTPKKTLSAMINPFLELFPGIEVEMAKPYKQQMVEKSIKAAVRHGFNLLEDRNQMVVPFVWYRLEQNSLVEWFLARLQADEKAGNIPQGAYAHWKQLQEAA